VVPKAGLDAAGKNKFLPAPGIESRLSARSLGTILTELPRLSSTNRFITVSYTIDASL